MGNNCCNCKESTQEFNEQKNSPDVPYPAPSPYSIENPRIYVGNINKLSDVKDNDNLTPTFNPKKSVQDTSYDIDTNCDPLLKIKSEQNLPISEQIQEESKASNISMTGIIKFKDRYNGKNN